MKPRNLFAGLALADLVSPLAVTFGSVAYAAGPEPAPDAGAEEEPAGRGPRDVADLEPATTLSAVKPVLAAGPGRHLYIIGLVGAAVPTFEGNASLGLEPTAPEAGDRLEAAAEPVRRYVDHLREEQAAFIGRMNAIAARPVQVAFQYQHAINGIAARLTADEAIALASDPAVESIVADSQRQLHTDQGPAFIGADEVWSGAGLPTGYQGEGMVIGVIDTGISPTNPSFADTSPDGVGGMYDTPAIRGGARYGICLEGQQGDELIAFDPEFPCNDKLIGAYVYDVGAVLPPGQSWDYDGHGSHTASTAGGNRVEGVAIQGTDFDISGVAPRAHIIAYLGCCSLAGLVASIDQAIADDVDVINYSIGSPSATGGWDEFDALGFLNARAAGILVATSNGNDGPGLYTAGSPADVPWVTSVGNQTHTRYNGNRLVDLTGGDTAPPADILGKGITGPLGATEIVYAGDDGDPMCLDLHPDQDLPPEGEGAPGNPTADHSTAWTGKIVVCDRGVNGRVQKSRNVDAQGAAGFVLVNDPGNGDSLTGDEFALPGVAIGNADGEVLKAWLADGGSSHTGAIAGFVFEFGPEYADFISASSSRGPNRFVDVLNPSVTAPGTDILAALVDPDAPAGTYGGTEYGMISGTSMASPHVAGAGALLMQAHTDWTPAQVQSALMTTASPTVQHHNGGLGSPDIQGSGRVRVDLAANAGLLFDETAANYIAADPAEGGDPTTLNLPSFMNSQCLAVCSWARSAWVPDDGGSNVPAGIEWTVSIDGDLTDDALGLTVTLNGAPSATVNPGDTIDIAVTADVDGAPEGVNLYGRITLTPSDPTVPTVTMPVLVVPSSAVLPADYAFTTRRNAGSQVLGPIQTEAVTDLAGSVAWVFPDVTEATLTEDPTPGDIYDDLGQVDVHFVTIPAGTASAEFEVVATDMSDLDMFVGTGASLGDVSEANEVAMSATATALEHVQLTNPEPGDYWVLIQNWEASAPGGTDPYTLNVALVPDQANGTGTFTAPAGTIPTGQEYDVTVTWDLPDLAEGDVVYGAAVLGGPLDSAGHIATMPLRLDRAADDVAKSAGVAEAASGDTIDYTITVQPNVTDTDLTYTIVDTLPDGLTVDGATVTGELDGEPIVGMVDGQEITWHVTMPSPFLGEFSYHASTPATNPACAAASGYVDIPVGAIPLVPAIDGDNNYVSWEPGVGPMPYFGQDVTTFWAGEDGFIATDTGMGEGKIAPWIPQALPDPAAPNGVIALLWSDLATDVAAESGVQIANSAAAGAAVVTWRNVFDFGDDATTPVGSMQLWMYNTVDAVYPEMTFEYSGLSAEQLASLSAGGATVGLEDDAGAAGAAVVSVADPYATLAEAGTICWDWMGPEYLPAVLTYSATVDADAASGTYTNTVISITDDPGDAETAVTADVNVTVAAAVPGAPTDVAATSGDDAASTVSWVAPADDGGSPITGYVVTPYIGTDAADPVAVDDPTATAHTVTGLTNGTAYTFTVAAVNAAGEGPESEPSEPATPMGPDIEPIPEPAVFAPIDPGRYWDTRDEPTIDELFSNTGRLADEATFRVQLTGRPGIPDGSTGVVANLTVIAPDGPGYATLYPCADTVPFVSTVNYQAGEVLANNVAVPLDDDGGVCVFTLRGADVALDVNGFVGPDAPQVGITPARYLDTRTGSGDVTFDGTGQGDGQVPAGGVVHVQIAGRGDVPDDAQAAIVNVTVVNPVEPGYVTLYPCTADVPTASTVNYFPGDVVPNGAVVDLSDDGELCIFTLAATDVLLDVTGFVPAGAEGITPMAPARLFDSRPGEPLVDGDAVGPRLAAGEWVEVQVTGRADIPDTATAAFFNVAVVFPDGPGFVTLAPAEGTEAPTTSNLNHVAGGGVRANNAFTRLSDDGTVWIFTLSGADIVLDVTGYTE